MARQNRSAGYCVHCQRGVTVVKPTGNGFFGRVRTAITNNEDSWVCSKCGNPATKGFTPPADTPTVTPEKNPSTTKSQDMVTDNPTATSLRDTHFDSKNAAEMDVSGAFTVATGPAESTNPEAVCHLCKHGIPFMPEDCGSAVTCPGCQATVLLPEQDRESLLTSSPAIIKLEDDPERPAISKSLCTLCQFEMTYPKKLTGKEVDCPSCNTHFQLP